jgi:hypothetical protein
MSFMLSVCNFWAFPAKKKVFIVSALNEFLVLRYVI